MSGKQLFYGLSTAVFIILFQLCYGQYIHPLTGVVFEDTHIPRIEVSLSQDALDLILEPGNEQSVIEYPSNVTFTTPQGSDLIANVGFRLRGNTSRYSAKKSFKISINAFVQGRDYKGLEKFNINGEHNDPSIVRSKLGWDLMRDAGALASRANHVELYVNGEYKGLYIHVEHIDEEYVEERFANKTGNLYKCLWPADLGYLGEDPNLYQLMNGDRPVYEIKINEEVADYSKLASFISLINNYYDTDFNEKLEAAFDVESFLRALAVEVLLGHWDNYSVNKNNYYLYENPVDGKIYYIPYDLDNTLGIDWFDIDWADFDIYQFYFPGENRPLVKRIMAISEYRRRFSVIMYEILRDHFNPEILFPRIDQLKEMIQSSAEADVYRTLDWGFTTDDFNTSYTNRLGNFHVRYGLKEYIQRRYDTATEQVSLVLAVDEWEREISIYPNPTDREFTIDLRAMKKGSKFIELTDLSGMVLLSFETESEILHLSKAQLPGQGAYTIYVRNLSGRIYTAKLIVN